MNLDRAVIPSLILALGVAVGGLLVGSGFARGRAAERYVTVKGVSEREVRADLAIWPIHLLGADNDLAAANAKLAHSVAGVRAFLVRHGVDTNQVQIADFAVADASANQYNNAERRVANRYVVHETLIVRSTNPDAILSASQEISELAVIGVTISSANGDYAGGSGPNFLFTGLNKLKPDMIADATARAREAATQFARDSRSDLGAIRQANQGVFEILPRDQVPGISESSQIAKVVRVVSTIDYYLR
jgi:hypothetical protein